MAAWLFQAVSKIFLQVVKKSCRGLKLGEGQGFGSLRNLGAGLGSGVERARCRGN